MTVTLADVLAALWKATPDWQKHRFGAIRAGEFIKYPNGSAQAQIASFTSDAGEDQRDADCNAAVLAVNYLRANAGRLVEMDVAVAQAVEFAEYVEQHAKGKMEEAARRFLSLPYAQDVAARLKAGNAAISSGGGEG